MPVFKRQIDNSPTIKILVPVQFKWNKSEVPFLEGREAAGVFVLWEENTDYVVPSISLLFPWAGPASSRGAERLQEWGSRGAATAGTELGDSAEAQQDSS